MSASSNSNVTGDNRNPNSEGDKLFAKAESCLSSSGIGKYLKFLSSKPDYDSAASYYEKAALAFRKNNPDKARVAYEKTAECQLENNQLFHSAKSCQQAALIHKEQGNVDECLKWFDQSVARFLEDGAPETAVLTLIQAAKIAAQTDYNTAVDRYWKAADIYENESNFNQAADVIREVPRLLLRITPRNDSAIENALQREIELNLKCDDGSRNALISRLVVCMVLFQLSKPNRNAAQTQLEQASHYPDFSETTEDVTLRNLIDAINQGQREMADEILNQPLFKYVDNEFSKLARDLRASPPEGLYPEEIDEDDLK